MPSPRTYHRAARVLLQATIPPGVSRRYLPRFSVYHHSKARIRFVLHCVVGAG
jgi:hypothetical protein